MNLCTSLYTRPATMLALILTAAATPLLPAPAWSQNQVGIHSVAFPLLFDGTCQYPTITAALLAAPQSSSVTIHIEEGLYVENLPALVGRAPVTLQPAQLNSNCLTLGDYPVTIDGGGVGRVIEIDDTELIAEPGITMASGSSNNGGCVWAHNSASLTLNSALIFNCSAGAGGGVSLDAASLIMNDVAGILFNNGPGGGGGVYGYESTVEMNGASYIQFNSAGGSVGGGVSLWGVASTLTMNDSSFIRANDAGNGGGVSVEGGATLEMFNNSHIGDVMGGGNSAIVTGGGVYLGLVAVQPQVDNTVRMHDDSQIIRNEASHGGGIGAVDGAMVEILDNAQVGIAGYGNTATGLGGGVYFVPNSLWAGLIRLGPGAAIGHNSADAGGGIYLGDLGLVGSPFSGTLVSNSATGDGGGLHDVSSNDVAFIGTTFDDNTAGGDGGGYYVINSDHHVLFSGCTLSNNDASNGSGGAIWFAGDPFTSQTLTLQNNTVLSDNTAVNGGGGGLYISDAELYTGAVWLHRNIAGFNGGGIESQGAILFINNDPAVGGCSNSGLGTDVYCSEFRDNTAGQIGGGIFSDDSTSQISRTAFIGNDAASKASALGLDDGSDGEVRNSIFIGNSPQNGTTVMQVHTVAAISPSSLDAGHITVADNYGIPILYGPNTSGPLRGNIIWNNGGNPVTVVAGNSISAPCNNVDFFSGTFTGPNRISADPLFVATLRSDYKLDAPGGSPSMDICNNGAVQDLDQRSRPVNGLWDQGAWEMQ